MIFECPHYDNRKRLCAKCGKLVCDWCLLHDICQKSRHAVPFVIERTRRESKR